MCYYVASPLFAAMFRRGIAFFDEIDKVPYPALAAFDSVLNRGTLYYAGIEIKRAPDFRFCAALNNDDETCIELPIYIRDTRFCNDGSNGTDQRPLKLIQRY